MLSPLFDYPVSVPELATHEIHIWRAALNLANSRFSKFTQTTLSMDERIRAEQFQFERDRNYFIVRRGILRTMLGSYLNVDPSRIQFSYGKNENQRSPIHLATEPFILTFLIQMGLHFLLSLETVK
jgi:hypothetical protein